MLYYKREAMLSVSEGRESRLSVLVAVLQGGERWKDSHNYYLQPRRARNQMHGGYAPVNFVSHLHFHYACLSLPSENPATPLSSYIISCTHV